MNSSFKLSLLLLAALAAVVVAGRWRMIERYAQPVPFHDQWTAEGTGIIEPWLSGDLKWSDIWRPHNEHRPVLTRILTLAEFVLTGRWDTRIQMLVNSVLFSLIAVALAVVVRHAAPGRSWIWTALAIAVLFALPANYENTVWGFQSQFYLLVLLGVVHIAGTFMGSRIGTAWIVGQTAGLLGLFSMGSGFIAPLVTAGISIVLVSRKRDRFSIATLSVATALTVAGFLMLPGNSAAGGELRAGSLMVYVDVLMRLLAWPSNLPVLAVLTFTPWFLVTLRVLKSPQSSSPGEWILCALGAWVVLQAAAIAHARGGTIHEIPPRYFDVLSIGLVTNGMCLALLRPALRRLGRLVSTTPTVLWCLTVVAGLWHFNSPTRVETWAGTNAALHRSTFEVVRDYISSGDPNTLTRDPFVAQFFPSAETMQRLLNNPRIRSSLPSELRPDESRTAAESITVGLIKSWPWLLGLSGALLVTSAIALFVRSGSVDPKPEVQGKIPWRTAAAVLGLVAIAMIAAGMRPWDRDPKARITRILESTGDPATGFEVPGAAGGIFALPDTPAEHFYGTYIDGDGFTGDLVSTEFTVSKSVMVVPVTGYPGGQGMSLRVELLGSSGDVLHGIAYAGPTPGETIRLWVEQLEGATGSQARLVLSDGSTAPRGWLGVGTPHFTDSIGTVRSAERKLDGFRAEDARRFPAALIILAALFLVAGVLERRQPVLPA